MPPHDQLDEDLLVNDEPENDLLRDPDPLRDPPLLPAPAFVKT